MMDDIKDGGPAFPFAATVPSNMAMQAKGMTLRDYAAIHGIGLDPDATEAEAAVYNRDPRAQTGDYLALARWFAKADATLRYLRADALVAAREVTG